MRLIVLILLLFALPALAVDTALVDRDGVTQPLVIHAPVYHLADYASLQAAVDAASAAGGGTVMNAKSATINIAATFLPKNSVKVDLNGGTLKWTGAASGIMVENDISAAGVKFFEMYNGDLDPGTNAVVGFKLHSIKQSNIHDITLSSANNATFEFMQLLPDSAVGDAANGERNVVDNVFGPFLSADGVVVKRVLTLTGSNPPWQVTTGNRFVGPWVFYAKEKGIVFKQYCDSNEFNGLFRITLANDTVPGTCVLFNDSATPSSAADVWGEHFTHLSCETWYPSLAGQKAVEINHAGGITIDYLGNDRVAQGTWPVGMVTDNYSQGHKITYVEGAPNYKVKEYVKGEFAIQGAGNGITFPDGSKQTTAPNDTAYDATSWDGNTAAPTKNAVRDKVESILATAGTGNVTGPVSATDNALAQYSGTTGRTIKDGPTLATSIGTPGSDSKVATEKAVRDIISTVAPSQSVGTTDTPTFAGTILNGSDWVAGTGTVSASNTSTITANTAGAFSVLKAGASIKLSSGTVIDVLSVTDTSNILAVTNAGTISALTWSYRNPAVTVQGNGVDYGYLKNTGPDIKGDGVSTFAVYDVHNWGSSSGFRGSRANGTPASPSAITTNNVITALSGQGWAGSVWANAGGIQLKAGEAWTSSTTGSYWAFNTIANGTTSPVERLRINGGGMQTEGLDDKTASFTVANSTSRITLATGTATATLKKDLPAGTTSVLVTVAGAAASGVSFAAESGGSLSWGDAGAPTFTNGKRAKVVCDSQNASATTTAAWDCVKGGNF